MINKNKKKIGYLLIFLAIILLVLAVLFFLMPEKNPFKSLIDRIGQRTEEREKTEEELFQEMLEERQAQVVYTFDEEAERNRDWNEDDFKQIARPFVERFGSYSNQSDYGNIEDLKMLMSSSMKSWADNYVSDLRSNSQYSGEFFGITTRTFIEPEIINFDVSGGQVEVLVFTQREESPASGEGKVYSQNIKIVFIKENSEWLVDQAIWQ